MHVLVLGGGAREHALAWRLTRDDSVSRVSIAPGNGGTGAVGRNIPDLDITDPDAVARHAVKERYGLAVVGPEAPLAAGVADALERARIPVFGPCREAARLEWSKSFAKQVMRRAGVPTAHGREFTDPSSAVAYLRQADREGRRTVVKADWLAAGKGVFVPETLDEAEAAVHGLFESAAGHRPGSRVLVEERLAGRELSLMALVSGERVVPLLPACDHKRLADGDAGPNTGGMGAYAPVRWFGRSETEGAVAEVLEPVAWRMARDRIPFRGVLYAGLMLTDDGVRVLEFNVRFGDPEAQALLPLFDGDLAAAVLACATGDAAEMERSVSWRRGAAVAVVVASEGYPDAPVDGRPLHGADPAAAGDDGRLLCFHGGTRRAGAGRIETSGGRVVTFVGRGDDVEAARETAYGGVSGCRLEGAQFRSDIGLSEIAEPVG